MLFITNFCRSYIKGVFSLRNSKEPAMQLFLRQLSGKYGKKFVTAQQNACMSDVIRYIVSKSIVFRCFLSAT